MKPAMFQNLEKTMTETSTLPAEVSAAISLRDIACEFKEDPLTTEGARSLKILVVKAVQMSDGLPLLWSLLTEDGQVCESGGYLRRMQVIDFFAVLVVDILTSTRDTIAATREKHPEWVPPSEAARLDPGLHTAKQLSAAIRETLDHLKRPRPAVSEEMLQRSREAYDRSEGETISDILARLESGGPLVKE